MALERVPADIRVEGGVARMSDPAMIKEIMEAVTIPVMAKARIGHFVECQVCCDTSGGRACVQTSMPNSNSLAHSFKSATTTFGLSIWN